MGVVLREGRSKLVVAESGRGSDQSRVGFARGGEHPETFVLGSFLSPLSGGTGGFLSGLRAGQLPLP